MGEVFPFCQQTESPREGARGTKDAGQWSVSHGVFQSWELGQAGGDSLSPRIEREEGCGGREAEQQRKGKEEGEEMIRDAETLWEGAWLLFCRRGSGGKGVEEKRRKGEKGRGERQADTEGWTGRPRRRGRKQGRGEGRERERNGQSKGRPGEGRAQVAWSDAPDGAMLGIGPVGARGRASIFSVAQSAEFRARLEIKASSQRVPPPPGPAP